LESFPLSGNLLEVGANNWEVVYNYETGLCADDEDINFMIAAIFSE
jgi:hypothetical protein